MSVPETRPSLLLRLCDPSDHEAWNEFVESYEHVVYRLAIRRGMQPADAEDLTQHVLWTVSHAISRFEPGPGRAKFRTWLQTIARRAIINAMTREPHDRGAGGSEVLAVLHEQAAPTTDTEQLRLEYRREVFHVAAAQIREEFQPETWQCFWDTVVRGRSVESVAEQFSRTRGSVYTARCRVIARLKQKVEQLDQRGDV